MTLSLARRAAAEFTGTALLVTAVVGSGIVATRLSPHDVGLELLENTIATVPGFVATAAISVWYPRPVSHNVGEPVTRATIGACR